MSKLEPSASAFSRAEEEQLIYAAQQGCQASLSQLMAGYETGLGDILAYQGHGRLSEEEGRQAGRLGLWQAILSYEGDSQERFWSLPQAIGQISTTIWQEVKRVEWQKRRASWHLRELSAGPAQPDPAQEWEREQIQEALSEAVGRLPERLGQIVVAYYGLAGEPPASSVQIGQRLGLTRQRIWQLRREALARLSHPSASYWLRSLLGRQSLADYLAAQRQVKGWLRRRGGRPVEEDDGQCV